MDGRRSIHPMYTAFRPITKLPPSRVCFSCSQNNFIVLELFVVLSQIFQELRRIFQPARIAEKTSRFVSLDKPIDKFIEEQKN